MQDSAERRIYFSDFFNVKHEIIEEYGALDISLICDNPAFVDPFLIFANPEYKDLHELVINYLKYLRDLSIKNEGRDLSSGDYKHYYKFPEVGQVWLGYSIDGNIIDNNGRKTAHLAMMQGLPNGSAFMRLREEVRIIEISNQDYRIGISWFSLPKKAQSDFGYMFFGPTDGKRGLVASYPAVDYGEKLLMKDLAFNVSEITE